MNRLEKSVDLGKTIWNKWLKGAFLAVLFTVTAIMTIGVAEETKAATEGFQTINGKGYYIKEDGSRLKGWKNIGGKKYLFDFETGVQVIGWQKDKWGKHIRYFTNQYGPKGYMATGLWQDGEGNVRHFNPKNGMMTRGWQYENGNHRFFDRKSGVMYRGIRKVDGHYYYFMGNRDPKKAGYRCKRGFMQLGEKRYYFSPSDGHAATGWFTVGEKKYYADPKGVMYRGIRKIGRYYYYFMGKEGVCYQDGLKSLGAKSYYFTPSDGHAHVGWLELDNKKYYFDRKGLMLKDTTFIMDGVKYQADSSGVVMEYSDSAKKYKYTVHTDRGGYVKAYDPKNGRDYYLAREFATHPGIADGKKTDRDLLAAICEAEAGDQGLVGMEAVALCILNRTIDPTREFPSELRFVIYEQGNPSYYRYPQYTPVRDGALLRKLNGHFYNRDLAYEAADKAMEIFQNYVKFKKPRKLEGIKRDDFDFKYFMMESSFWKQPLDFSRVDKLLYKDHMFFVDWV